MPTHGFAVVPDPLRRSALNEIDDDMISSIVAGISTGKTRGHRAKAGMGMRTDGLKLRGKAP